MEAEQKINVEYLKLEIMTIYKFAKLSFLEKKQLVESKAVF